MGARSELERLARRGAIQVSKFFGGGMRDRIWRRRSLRGGSAVVLRVSLSQSVILELLEKATKVSERAERNSGDRFFSAQMRWK